PSVAAPPAAAAPRPETDESQTVLLFQSGPREQFAVPLAMIRRIEEVQAGRIEHVGDREVVTAGGQSVRVLRLDHYPDVSPAPAQDTLFLLLPRHLRRPVGILISRVLDTHQLTIRLDTGAYRAEGVLGTAVVRDRLTLFLDLFRLADRALAGENGPGR